MLLNFRLEKWESMLTPELEKRYMNIGGGNTRIGEFLQYQLAINILEASDTDRQARANKPWRTWSGRV